MATLKKDGMLFSNGREISIPNGILSITRSLELADYYSRNILFFDPASKTDKQVEPVKNIYDLTKDELIEVADCMIQLWINLKDNTRKHGIKSAEIFNMR